MPFVVVVVVVVVAPDVSDTPPEFVEEGVSAGAVFAVVPEAASPAVVPEADVEAGEL